MIVDIMLPYYGDVALMQAAVRSVIAQSDPDWRLTVVDDGKEPGVPEWFAALGTTRGCATSATSGTSASPATTRSAWVWPRPTTW